MYHECDNCGRLIEAHRQDQRRSYTLVQLFLPNQRLCLDCWEMKLRQQGARSERLLLGLMVVNLAIAGYLGWEARTTQALTFLALAAVVLLAYLGNVIVHRYIRRGIASLRSWQQQRGPHHPYDNDESG